MTPFLDLIFNDLVFGLGVPLLVTAGGLLLSDEFKRFGAARVCFYLAAAWICGRVLMWSVFTSETTYVRFIATFLAFGIVGIGLTESIRATNHRENSLKNTEQEPKKPEVQQSSQGANSPNIVGNNNTVNIGDPKVAARLDEITKLLKAQGDRATPKNLLTKYPLGYIIFDVDYMNSVFPYRSQALDAWDFDWSVVKVSPLKLPGETEDLVGVRLPDIRVKGRPSPLMQNIGVAGPKKVGAFPGTAFSDSVINMKVEILAIRENGIVFLLGFTKNVPQPH